MLYLNTFWLYIYSRGGKKIIKQTEVTMHSSNWFKLLLLFFFFLSITAFSQVHYYTELNMLGSNEVPSNSSTGTGVFNGWYDESTMMLGFTASFEGLSSNTSAAHFHGPAPADSNAGVQIGWTGFPTGVTSGTFSDSVTLDATQETQLLAGRWYANIHTSTFPGGEIRTQLFESNPIYLFTNLLMSGSQEVPPNGSSGTGTLNATYNENTNELIFNVDFSGLSSNTTAAHFHGPAPADSNAGVQIGWTGFPTGVTSGTFSDTVTLTEPQEDQLLAGRWYANIHTSTLPGGEIRTQLIGVPIPVELTSFTASVTGKSVALNWTTATELNNSGFEIQRSIDNANWNAISFIRGRGTTSSLAEYSYIDNSISAGKYFYRLKQVDFNGSYEFSNIVEVFVGIPKGFVLEQNYPNPFNPSTIIKFGFDKSTNTSLKVYDVLGNEVVNLFNENAEAGRIYEIDFNASGLSSGVYYYKLSGDNKTEIKKMLLLK